MGEQRNLIIAVALALLILLGYEFFISGPAKERAREQIAEREAALASDPATPDIDAPPPAPATLEERLSTAQRVPIETPSLRGSLNLTGARFDDLKLLGYGQTVDPDSERVRVLQPGQAPGGYYVVKGWFVPGVEDDRLPNSATPWRLVAGEELTPDTPITLEYDGYPGLTFRRTISVDDNYMFTLVDRVTNASDQAVTLHPYGSITQNGKPADLANFYILFEGMQGVFDGDLRQRKYNKVSKDGPYRYDEVQSGWLGVTSKYWLTALIPMNDASFTANYRSEERPLYTNYTASYASQGQVIPAGGEIVAESRVFSGAKRQAQLVEYRKEYGIDRFEDAIDWGNFAFLTKPFFFLLHNFGLWTGSFGIAILMLTVVVKAVFFPIANSSYKAMARMKAVQPEMTKLRERFKDDPQRQQQELIKLYKKEKVNPLAGCLPLLPQMVVFYALYKTLFVTIEMRHAPFFGWINDLSAPDPTNMWNLFGLLPYDPSGWPVLGGFLAIGAWPLIMGISMAAMQSLNPPPPDKMQQRIFAFMPVIFTIILAPFAAGLVIYWTWNNILSFAQQYVIIRRQKVDTPIGTFLSNEWAHVKKGAWSETFVVRWPRAIAKRFAKEPAAETKS